MALFHWQTLRRRTASHRELAKRIQDTNGSAGLTLDLPWPLAHTLPRFSKECFYRLSVVRLESPTDELLEEVLQLPILSRLRIGGGSYDLRLLDELARKPFLQAFRLSGRKLDAELVAAVGSAKQLQSINFMRTNVTARAVDRMAEIVRLQGLVKLSLTRCELDAEIMAVLLQRFPSQLLVLNLSDSTVDGRSLLDLAYKFPYVLFDMSNADTDPKALDYLVSEGRLATDYADPISEAVSIRNRVRTILHRNEKVFGEVDPSYFDPETKNLGPDFSPNLPLSLGMPLPTARVVVPQRTSFSFEGLGVLAWSHA